MWAISKQKVENFFGRMTQSMYLDAKKIINWYSYILFIAPLLFWALIAMRSGASRESIQSIIMKQPVVAIGTIIAIVDFVLGYYLLLNKKKFMVNRQTYRFFMVSQLIGQIVVGNLLCAILAVLGMYKATALKKTQDNVNPVIIAISIASAVILAGCLVLILLLEF
ncbi:hypothetical protein EFR95_05780 [Lactobacillus amylovorus]|jgi:uncharacterized membrane protein|uniref:hypothetical protein n=1 Tax=Lactobacillus amylovorus TaxID=1604 RepID=UPI001F3E8547|nr:hypothetical protein [Lactobacillus amylovorus]MCH3996793.1 hypothetical protein [Lactobacillus amylovorus]MCH4139942.1 hypothetical protein [Lactobacillus amylovorus]MCI1532115.1 hypothetical protein [Lactobacillus amylovorus]MCT3585856.1 hypothetical protein [Lactobacillus amylovorus]MDB6222217.1 hypothetical protein [Lactobacillus amylovorus]